MEPNDGAALIAAERRRQVEVEGWTAEHDDAHDCGEMVEAAICYAEQAKGRGWVSPEKYRQDEVDPFGDWPWDESWWKPQTPIRDLVRAGALIAAEIDRLQRLALRTAQEEGNGNQG